MRKLGRELRSIREDLSMSTYQAAARLDWNQSKVSRIENARVQIDPDDIAKLLSVYGVETQIRAVLMELAEQATELGWWTGFGVFKGAYVALEDAATKISALEPQVIPGLLQTAEYARAVFSVEFDPAEVELRTRARMARQAVLTRENAPFLDVIIDESVLQRPVGGGQTMRNQLASLLEAANRPRISVRVMPMAVGAHAGLDGPFVILSFERDDPDVAYMENVGGDVYVEGAAQLDQIRLRWRRIESASLSAEESAALITDILKE